MRVVDSSGREPLGQWQQANRPSTGCQPVWDTVFLRFRRSLRWAYRYSIRSGHVELEYQYGPDTAECTLLAWYQRSRSRCFWRKLPECDRQLRESLASIQSVRHSRTTLECAGYEAGHRSTGDARPGSLARVLDLSRDEIQE